MVHFLNIICHSTSKPFSFLQLVLNKQFKRVSYNSSKMSYETIFRHIWMARFKKAAWVWSELYAAWEQRKDTQEILNAWNAKFQEIYASVIQFTMSTWALIQGSTKQPWRKHAIFLSWHSDATHRAARAAAKWAEVVKWGTFLTLYIKHPQGHREERKEEWRSQLGQAKSGANTLAQIVNIISHLSILESKYLVYKIERYSHMNL